MIRCVTRFGLGLLAILALLLSTAVASAQDNWTDGSGNWSTPGNWSAGVPGAGATVNITDSDGVSRTVTYDYTGSAVSLDSLAIDLTGGSSSATNTLSMSANNLTVDWYGGGGGEVVGYNGTGTFTQIGGTNTINDPGDVFTGAFILGANSGASGTYNLMGGVLSFTSTAINEYVGSFGTGNFNQNGGTNNSAILSIGNSSNSNGSYSLSGTGTLSSTLEIVGEGGTGNFTQSGGSNTITGFYELDLGTLAGSSGNYSLTGGTLSAPSVWVSGNSYDPGGTGVLTVSGTGSATVTGTLKVYNTSGTMLNLSGGTINTGSLDLSGTPALLNWTVGTLNLTNSSVELDNSANNWNGFSSLTLNLDMALGVSGAEKIGGSGTGSLTLAGGSNSVGASGLSVGFGVGSNGTLTMSGNASLSSFGNEAIGVNGTGVLNQSGGTNSPLSSNVSLGVNSGSSGSYTLSGGTLLSAASIYVGGSSAGPGGTGVLTVSGSGFIANAGPITVYNTAGSGFNVDGGSVGAASLNLLGTYTQTAGSATYGHITGGGQMNVSGGQVTLTDHTSGHLASVSVSGPATLGFDLGDTTSSQITADTATFTATPTIAFNLSGFPDAGTVFTLLSATHLFDNGNLGSLASQAVVIGRDTLTPSLSGGSGASGAIIVTVSGGPANLTWIGNNNVGFDGGGAWDTQTTNNWDNHSNEALTPDVFYAGDHVTFDDTASNFVVDLNSGDVIAKSVTFNNSMNPYTVNGVNGIGGDTNVTFAGSNSVTLNNYNSYSGTTTISGGGTVSIAGSIASPTVNVTNGTLQLAADNALTGTPVVTLGNGTTTGTLDLYGTQNSVGGLAGGSGNLVTNTSSGLATLNFSDGTSAFGGVIQDGNAGGQVALNINSGSLTLGGTNTYTGGTMVSGGSLAVNGSILGDVAVNYGATLAGHGSVGGMVTVNYGGILSPGCGSTPGAITLGGLALYSGSQTNIKLAGTTAGSQYDQVQVTGSASLAGTLTVALVGGFQPQAGETFDILTGSTPSGTFDTVELPGLTGALNWDSSQLYTNGTLSVDETFLLGDFNRDGHVNAADIVPMEQALANLPAYDTAKGLTNAQLLAIGDINGDGAVNNADLQSLLNLLKSGGGSADPVPEPSTFVLAVVALGMLWCRSRYCLGQWQRRLIAGAVPSTR